MEIFSRRTRDKRLDNLKKHCLASEQIGNSTPTLAVSSTCPQMKTMVPLVLTMVFGLILIAILYTIEFGLTFIAILYTMDFDPIFIITLHYGFWPNFHRNTTHWILA